MPHGNGGVSVVTGAFGYTGKYIARRLLAAGRRVRTLTNHPNRDNPFGDVILTHDEIERLMASLLVCPGEPTGKIRLSDWLMENSAAIGRTYASELARHLGKPQSLRL
jgi:NAD(P)-dependent dehydrogenase (short-subunit alcohol dehydrogenase family)